MFCRIRDKQPGCAGIPAEVDISGLRLYRLPVIRSGDSLTFILNKNMGDSFFFSGQGRSCDNVIHHHCPYRHAV